MLTSVIPALAESAATTAASPIVGVTAATHVEDLGQVVDSFTVQLADGFDAAGIGTDNIFIENNYATNNSTGKNFINYYY